MADPGVRFRADLGYPVGILANNGILFSESALKGTHFIELCTQRGIRCFSANITGFMSVANTKTPVSQGRRQDGHRGGNRRCAEVTVISRQLWRWQLRHVRRAYGPRFLWMWPNARISVMGGEQAASVLAQVRRDGLTARSGLAGRGGDAAHLRQYEAAVPP